MPAEDYSRHYVDMQRDATVADIRRAVGAGLRSVEHVKRFTTIGTGSDQGKTANVNAIRVAAELLGVTPASSARRRSARRTRRSRSPSSPAATAARSSTRCA